MEDGDLPCTTAVEQNYTYVFNICGTVAHNVPSECQKISNIASAGAIQINKRGTIQEDDDYCYIAGSYSDKTTTLNLIDQDDPTLGLTLTYFGDYCSGNDQRKFKIELQCADKLSPVPTHALEYKHCEYTITVPSVYGCPMECPVSNRHLCGGNGHCAYDSDLESAKCFCNKGYSGKDCSSSSSSSSSSLNYSPALLGLIITLFVIISLLVGSILFMFRQIKAYKEDMANYQVLKGGDDDSTVV